MNPPHAQGWNPRCGLRPRTVPSPRAVASEKLPSSHSAPMPIWRTVSVTLTPPIRVAALVGVLVATGFAAFVFLVGRGASEDVSAPTTPATRPATQTTTPSNAAQKPLPAKVGVATKSGFPVSVDRALRRRGVVVVVVYLPGAAVDAVVRTEARAAASQFPCRLCRDQRPERAARGIAGRQDRLPSGSGCPDRQAPGSGHVEAQRHRP